MKIKREDGDDKNIIFATLNNGKNATASEMKTIFVHQRAVKKL